MPFKRVSARLEGQQASTNQNKNNDPKLVGEASEVNVLVNGFEVKALCDTGSCVSTCSENFHEEKLSSVPLQPLSNLIKIECANGDTLPYKGFVAAD